MGSNRSNKFFRKLNNLEYGESGLESFSNLQGDDSGLRVNQPANLDDSVLGGGFGDGDGGGDDGEGGGGGGAGNSFLGRSGAGGGDLGDTFKDLFADDKDPFDAQSDNLSARSHKRRKMDQSYPAGYQVGGSSSSSSSDNSSSSSSFFEQACLKYLYSFTIRISRISLSALNTF